ncbi:MAG: alanine/glycine:cation symporter family protein [Pseudomonadales bacterium]|jgi:AGCS family alanine or glycine:cation symporter|nr:alanine/glycine:cation symporter family protein [Pseudomonadales bacterium]MDP6470080.1 alanine/glycine:cation symporter family protein [Pseudomonadales bacterium]MDP6826983.1 alanine/glycine:cation symporter family protein [Pseudomonadales bacterium]MDP6971078.1 alanine/glycine:cation symporter family protein [Pseudomonadales bacterium]
MENTSLDQAIDQLMRPVADAVSGFIFFSIEAFGAEIPLIVLWLIAGGVFFTVYLRFVNVRGFLHAIDIVRGKYADPDHPGEISQFQALTTAVSGTVGIGNIAGVAVAISVGGPGATLWLIIAGFLGMSTKLAECTLGVMYRDSIGEVAVAGGPMYYLKKGLAERNWPTAGKVLGVFYALAMVVGCLGIGNMFQSNQAAAIFIDVTGGQASFFADKAWLVGLLLAASVAAVIIGGIRSIAQTTSKLVPVMALLYVITALIILAINYSELPGAIAAIWTGAFSPEGLAGGFIGAMIIGFRRAVFSNEAGLGSAAIAHSAARTDEPVSEGYVALLEPFIDTVVICTMTALVITTTVYDPALAAAGVSGIELTTRAFASTLSWSPVPLSVAAILFAFSTMITWSYYGLRAFTYLTGDNRTTDLAFKLFFLSFVVLGSSVELGALVGLSDALVFVVAIPNLIGLYLLAPTIRRAVLDYEMRVVDHPR